MARSEPITVKVTPHVREQLEKLAREEGKPRSAYINSLLEQHVPAEQREESR